MEEGRCQVARQVAIDGPAGAGKSTVARRVAEALGYTFVDTGAMYRCVALAALRAGVTLEEPEALTELAEQVAIRFGPLEAGRQEVWLDGERVTEAIRTPEISDLASPVSAVPGVRAALLDRQRQFAEAGPVVMEGRDIQTVVLPNADLKVFLDASPEERARRRHAEQPDSGLTVEQIAEAIAARDQRDRSRAVAPLQAAPDAVHLDTDGLTIEEVVARVVELAQAASRGDHD